VLQPLFQGVLVFVSRPHDDHQPCSGILRTLPRLRWPSASREPVVTVCDHRPVPARRFASGAREAGRRRPARSSPQQTVADSPVRAFVPVIAERAGRQRLAAERRGSDRA
jgi:hypothetical protein